MESAQNKCELHQPIQPSARNKETGDMKQENKPP